MFIDSRHNNKPQLRRSGILSRLRQMSLLRSCGTFVQTRFYKYFVPMGLSVFVVFLLAVLSSVPFARVSSSNLSEQSPQQQMQFPEGLDYSKFQHDSRNHSRLPCLLCHRRDSNAAVPKRPGSSQHLPCAGCHAQQFSSPDSPICTICHTDPKSGAVKPFPSRLMSFRMKFDHARHVAMGSVSCASCHKPARAGVAMTIPADFNAHTTCFRCHTPRAQSNGRDISSCGTCHQLGRYSRTPMMMPAFRVGFSHAKHDKVTCNERHDIRCM